MIVIVDSGSTKCDWFMLSRDGNLILDSKKQTILSADTLSSAGLYENINRYKIRTQGLNPAVLSEEELHQRVGQHSDLQNIATKVEKLYFYGAGCSTPEASKRLHQVLAHYFNKANEIVVKEDTYAAAYATLNHEKEAALICILGTGSNCSYYDGTTIIQKVTSLGYILMDDASGNYFGKELLKGYYYRQMPDLLRADFEQSFDLRVSSVENHLYREAGANRYLATFAHFLLTHYDNPYIKNMITEGIISFSRNMILQYKEYFSQAPVHFAGSIAHFSQDIIHHVANEMGYRVGNIIRRPIEQLVQYHIKQISA